MSSFEFTSDPIAGLQIDAAIARGLQAGGELILAASDALAPREDGEPRHGEHMTDTGFVRPETATGEPRVAIGYMAYWATWQEVKDEYHHDHGEAHFLEKALLATSDAALEKTAETMRAEIDG